MKTDFKFSLGKRTSERACAVSPEDRAGIRVARCPSAPQTWQEASEPTNPGALSSPLYQHQRGAVHLRVGGPHQLGAPTAQLPGGGGRLAVYGIDGASSRRGGMGEQLARQATHAGVRIARGDALQRCRDLQSSVLVTPKEADGACAHRLGAIDARRTQE